MSEVIKLPTLADLVADNESRDKEGTLTFLLNQEPPPSWIKEHPITKQPYLPIDKTEFTLKRIYGSYSTVVKDVKVIANSVAVTVTLIVKNPVTGEIESHDGVGAVAIQTDSGKGAMEWNYAKSNGVQLALPAAKTYAIKDAAENFGKLFGKDLTRKDTIGYNSFLKTEAPKVDHELDRAKQMFANCLTQIELDQVFSSMESPDLREDIRDLYVEIKAKLPKK